MRITYNGINFKNKGIGVEFEMRKILSRGKSIDNNQWIYGYYDKSTDCIIDKNNSAFIVDFGTIGHFTGIVDKNGNKIFEGDIVNIKGYTEPLIIYVNNDYSCYALGEGEEKIYIQGSNTKNVVVIGNIYDNPELMEK